MKRILKKRTLLIVGIVVCLVIAAAAVAFAFSASASTNAVTVTSASAGLTLDENNPTPWNGQMPAPLVPTVGLDSSWVPGNAVDPNAWGPDHITLTNTGGVDFSHVLLTDSATGNANDVGAYIHVLVYDQGYVGTWTVDQLASGSVDLGALAKGPTAANVYLIFWLDQNAPNGVQSSALTGLQFTFSAS